MKRVTNKTDLCQYIFPNQEEIYQHTNSQKQQSVTVQVMKEKEHARVIWKKKKKKPLDIVLNTNVKKTNELYPLETESLL